MSTSGRTAASSAARARTTGCGIARGRAQRLSRERADASERPEGGRTDARIGIVERSASGGFVAAVTGDDHVATPVRGAQSSTPESWATIQNAATDTTMAITAPDTRPITPSPTALATRRIGFGRR